MKEPTVIPTVEASTPISSITDGPCRRPDRTPQRSSATVPKTMARFEGAIALSVVYSV